MKWPSQDVEHSIVAESESEILDRTPEKYITRTDKNTAPTSSWEEIFASLPHFLQVAYNTEYRAIAVDFPIEVSLLVSDNLE